MTRVRDMCESRYEHKLKHVQVYEFSPESSKEIKVRKLKKKSSTTTRLFRFLDQIRSTWRNKAKNENKISFLIIY